LSPRQAGRVPERVQQSPDERLDDRDRPVSCSRGHPCPDERSGHVVAVVAGRGCTARLPSCQTERRPQAWRSQGSAGRADEPSSAPAIACLYGAQPVAASAAHHENGYLGAVAIVLVVTALAGFVAAGWAAVWLYKDRTPDTESAPPRRSSSSSVLSHPVLTSPLRLPREFDQNRNTHGRDFIDREEQLARLGRRNWREARVH